VRRVTVPTADAQQLEAFIIAGEAASRCVLYFHGNAGNISQRLPQVQTLASLTRTTVLAISYRGYGASTGTPSERGIYRDGEAALRYAREELGFAEADIFLCGVSLGTAVAVEVAQDRPLAGLILVTPMTSGRDLARDHGRGGMAWLAGGAFASLTKVPRLRAPALVLHGPEDEVIPYAQGLRLFEAIPTPKRFVAIHGARHNNIAYADPHRFWTAIEDFVREPPARE
jgi:pimeloyl-ACP methyl ester carboxylesterase